MKNKILEIIQRNLSLLDDLSGYERYTLNRVLQCRCETVPFMVSRCDHCGKNHPVYQSCRNRMCPRCNGGKSIRWLAQREAELLPTSYFLLTFTIPRELRVLFLYNKLLSYNLLFQAASRSLLQEIHKGFRSLQGEAGFFTMLHTWDQRLNFHPHLHVVIPSGCISPDRTRWNPSYQTFLLPVRRLSCLFRQKLLSALKKAAGQLILPPDWKLMDLMPLINSLYQKDWVVHSKAPSKKSQNPRAMIRYLSRYVSKTPVQEERILKVTEGRVHLKYMDRKKNLPKTEDISEQLFLKRLV
ncbi:MAG: transposase, partial [Spirochaetales bacterium]|nr:transposase [Spirochaetales bacterium]